MNEITNEIQPQFGVGVVEQAQNWHIIHGLESKVLVHEQCGHPVGVQFGGAYSCDHCDSWVVNVVWRKVTEIWPIS